jgi:hypothetical protein
VRSAWLLILVALSVSTSALVGCASSPRTEIPRSAELQSAPADSPLSSCVNPAPTTPKAVDTTIARDFARGRVRRALSLDGGAFRAVPPAPTVVPRIGAALALCNLLAGSTANNFSVFEAAAEHGMSFGLGVVTIADSILKTGPHTYLVGGEQQTASLQPYHARLAWIAVTLPDLISSCPVTTNRPSASPTAELKALPGYQILAIDAQTGADGIIYSTEANALCGFPGYQPASIAPAVEYVSVPWTLVNRGPGPQSATITYASRPCDQPIQGSFIATNQPVVLADRTHPGLVAVDLDRILTTCGPAAQRKVLLRSSTLRTNLPGHLVHAVVGALDIPN